MNQLQNTRDLTTDVVTLHIEINVLMFFVDLLVLTIVCFYGTNWMRSQTSSTGPGRCLGFKCLRAGARPLYPRAISGLSKSQRGPTGLH